ncbi:50S ribosomal protein L18 [Vulgatibacter sp.]|uniref:50S ribosomal protein L18 n=1 Tax=Vulgatibacter sp. TaxID=1971226 RepID=UPI0035642A28
MAANVHKRKLSPREQRAARIRKKLSGTTERPRLTVFKSNKHIYAQIIDDTKGATLAFASTQSKELKDQVNEADKSGAAKLVGKLVAEKAKAANVNQVVFDRNGFPYHGRIAAVADAAREAGLEF